MIAESKYPMMQPEYMHLEKSRARYHLYPPEMKQLVIIDSNSAEKANTMIWYESKSAAWESPVSLNQLLEWWQMILWRHANVGYRHISVCTVAWKNTLFPVSFFCNYQQDHVIPHETMAPNQNDSCPALSRLNDSCISFHFSNLNCSAVHS